jgi:hypothetical protein
MVRHRRLLWGLASLALLGSIATQARAELITMTVYTSTASFNVDLVGTPGATTYSVDATGLGVINAFLTSDGSEYQFIGLGGSSNFPGNSGQGNLVLSGEVQSVVGGGTDTFLKIVESESNFTAPTSTVGGTLKSSSTGNFTNQPSGGGHTASSMFNAISTPVYSVLSDGTVVNPEGSTASTSLSSVTTLYTLTNNITFGLAAATTNNIDDTFGVTATVIGATIPEPSSLVMFLMGLPLPFVALSLLRRLRRWRRAFA